MSEERRERDPGFLASLRRFLVSLRKTESKGILIQKLRAGDLIAIRTQNSMYVLKVLDPEERKVEITGNGQHFNEPTVTCARGSRLAETGPAIISGWIAVGHCLELASGNTFLSATQRVSVNTTQVLPVTDGTDN